MAKQADEFYKAQIDASKGWASQQSQLQQEQSDFVIEKIEQEKAQAQKDYTKEQSGAYVDWQKQSNRYGANAEQMAASGLFNDGYSESAQVSLYNTYQNRVMTARESYNNITLNFSNAMKDARLQNNSALAEIAYKALQDQLQLSLSGFQYKNQLILDKANAKTSADQMYYNRYQDVLAQINSENALAEQIRQYNEQMAFEREQWDYQTGKSRGGGSNYYVRPTSPEEPPEEPDGENVLNKHTDTWVEVSGKGRYTWAEVYDFVESGQIIESVTKDGLVYKWNNDKK